MYGAFGTDFATKDGRRVMVVAISLRQWESLTRRTGIEEHLPPIERAFGPTSDAKRTGTRGGTRSRR